MVLSAHRLFLGNCFLYLFIELYYFYSIPVNDNSVSDDKEKFQNSLYDTADGCDCPAVNCDGMD